MSENAEYQPWMDSPWVSTLEDYENTTDEVTDVSKIAWFDVKLNLGETELERKEKVEAMQEQIKMGILQPNGFPVGMQAPPGAVVEGAIRRQGGFQGSFNFPGAIGVPLPSKFNSTPVTKQLQAASNKPTTALPRAVPGILPNIPFPHQLKDRNVFDKGEENLRRIQELTRDRRK